MLAAPTVLITIPAELTAALTMLPEPVSGEDEPLFKVTLIHTGSQTFALLVSLSHAIGDVATFYSLYTMLDPGRAKPSLDPTRVEAFDSAALHKAFGPEAAGVHAQLRSTDPKAVSQLLKMHRATSQRRSQKVAALLQVNEECAMSHQYSSH